MPFIQPMDAKSALEKKVGTVSSDREQESFFDGHEWVGYRTYVKLVRENSGFHRPYLVKAPVDVYRAFAKLSECDRERFYAVHLDGQNRVCGVELVSQGTVGSSLVTPREVYKSAILANASGIILVHNPPSGDTSPSREDLQVTERLTKAGELLGIRLLDSLVVTEGAYHSQREETPSAFAGVAGGGA